MRSRALDRGADLVWSAEPGTVSGKRSTLDTRLSRPDSILYTHDGSPHTYAPLCSVALGRVLVIDKPKYLNSPETPVYHKGASSTACFEARQQTVRLDDVGLSSKAIWTLIALAQHGLWTNAVATLGTPYQREHLQL